MNLKKHLVMTLIFVKREDLKHIYYLRVKILFKKKGFWNFTSFNTTTKTEFFNGILNQKSNICRERSSLQSEVQCAGNGVCLLNETQNFCKCLKCFEGNNCDIKKTCCYNLLNTEPNVCR
jgi:hypothetical protein